MVSEIQMAAGDTRLIISASDSEVKGASLFDTASASSNVHGTPSPVIMG